MSKAFTSRRRPATAERERVADEAAKAPVTALKNYITPSGLQRLKDEHRFLLTRERPAVT